MANLVIQEIGDGVVFAAKIVPGSRETTVCGLYGGMLKVKVAAAPEKGKANQCLLEFLAKQLGVKKNTVRIIAGEKARVKRLQVTGISPEMLLTRLSLMNK
jgi:uncharacterized protein (TIGR00251 family)